MDEQWRLIGPSAEGQFVRNARLRPTGRTASPTLHNSPSFGRRDLVFMQPGHRPSTGYGHAPRGLVLHRGNERHEERSSKEGRPVRGRRRRERDCKASRVMGRWGGAVTPSHFGGICCYASLLRIFHASGFGGWRLGGGRRGTEGRATARLVPK